MSVNRLNLHTLSIYFNLQLKLLKSPIGLELDQGDCGLHLNGPMRIMYCEPRLPTHAGLNVQGSNMKCTNSLLRNVSWSEAF